MPRTGKQIVWADTIALTEAARGGVAITPAGALADDGAGVILGGVTEYGGAIGDGVNVCKLGTIPVIVDDDSAAIAVGDKLGLTADGEWIKKSSSADRYYGVARSTTTGGTAEECDMDLLSLAPLLIP